MKKYTATFTAEIEIECENIVQAKRLAKRIRTVYTDNCGWTNSGGKFNVSLTKKDVKVFRKDER